MSTASVTTAATTDDGRIYHPLDQLRGIIRRFVVFDGLLAAALLIMAWFWLGLVADFGLFKLTGFDWVQDAPRAFRGIALGVLVLLTIGILVRRIALRLTREFSYPSLALVLEKRVPNVLGDKLITAIELADVKKQEKYGYSGDMIREVITEAREAVAKVPVSTVFNWRRLWMKGILFVVAGIGLTGTAFGIYAALGGVPAQFPWRSMDVATIWGERNLLLKNTPWPRRAHLELIDFPADELRVGKDAPPPKIRARAFQWVIADNNSWDGWRPLKWSDAVALGAIGDGTTVPASLGTDDPLVDTAESGGGVSNVIAKLDELAVKPSMSRTLRKLEIPSDVSLTYHGPKTSGTFSLTREPSGDYTGEITGLKESVRFVVRGADFATKSRLITLVPPPMFLKLTRTEYQPAYLYYPAPVDGTFQSLRGLRQVFPNKDLSLTGDRTVHSVPAGTELELSATADKPLKRVYLTPKAGKIPGAELGSSKPVEVPVTGDSFTIAFRGADQITAPVELEITLVDFDDVKSSRGVLIQVTEDQGPQVEVAVDVLRKQGNTYLCTPMAMVPFLTDSLIRDDTGLSDVAYEFTYSKQEAAIVVGLQAQALAGLWASAPITPNIGSAIIPTVSSVLASSLTRGEKKSFGRVTVLRFEEDYRGLKKDTLEALKAKMSQPIDTARAERPDVVKQIKFQDAIADVFDLERAMPDVRARDTADIQSRFRVELNLVATDVNYETGPKRGQNVEPIRLLVVSEQDLLAEISKDEEGLIGKMDDLLKKLRAAQTKLNETADRLISPNPPADIVVSSAVRALDILQDVGKGRDITQGILTDYRRLRREAEVNRCNRALVDRFDTLVINPFDAVLLGEFPAADQALTAFQGPLAAGARPDEGTQSNARLMLATLIAKIQLIRDACGEAVNINKLREDLRQILERQRLVSKALDDSKRVATGRLFAPKIGTVPALVLMKGEKKKVKHRIDWNVFEDGQIQVKIETPQGGGVTAPLSLVVKDDRDDFEYELTAGDKPGDYPIRLVPSVGEPVTVNVTVK